MTNSDTIMEYVEVWGGFPEERDAPTQWPFTSCSACSIFNVSQLTAVHTGSLVRNATQATTPAWQAHALVVLLSSLGLPHTPRGGGGVGVALTMPVIQYGVIGVVSVFHWKAPCPLEPARLFLSARSLPELVRVARVHGAQSQRRGLSRGQQASLPVVY